MLNLSITMLVIMTGKDWTNSNIHFFTKKHLKSKLNVKPHDNWAAQMDLIINYFFISWLVGQLDYFKQTSRMKYQKYVLTAFRSAKTTSKLGLIK